MTSIFPPHLWKRDIFFVDENAASCLASVEDTPLKPCQRHGISTKDVVPHRSNFRSITKSRVRKAGLEEALLSRAEPGLAIAFL